MNQKVYITISKTPENKTLKQLELTSSPKIYE